MTPSENQATLRADQRLLVVLSGPSGSGKETLLGHVLKTVAGMTRVTTYTTRPPRPGEVQRKQYHFITEDEFDRYLADGTIFESETVYGSFRYGSPRTAVDGAGGGDLIMELDPKGYRTMAKARPGPTIGIFLLVPDFDELRRRIVSRHPETDIDHRLKVARDQLADANDYDYVMLNDDLGTACRNVADIVAVEQLRRNGRAFLDATTRG